MLFLVHTRLNSSTRAICSGLTDAQHYDTLQAMRPLLEQLGEVRIVDCPDTEVDSLFRQAGAEQRRCLFLSFTLPHNTPVGMECPTVAVFDWGYDTVPDHDWQHEPRNDWLWVMSQLAGVITGSHFSASVLRSAAGQRGITLPIAVVPLSPPAISDSVGATAGRPSWLDTRTADLQQLSPALFEKHQQSRAANASGRSWPATLLSRLKQAVARLLHSGPGTLVSNRDAVTSLSSYECRSANLEPPGAFQQWRERQIQPWLRSEPPSDLTGVVYTAIQNPLDHHNLYHDLITAFCDALREQANAILVLHLEHRDSNSALQPYLEELYRLHPFQCRVVICIGEPDATWWAHLAEVAHYHIHISRGDGSCPRLLQMMSAGKPAITSQATAMGDVARPANSFIAESGREPTWWPHDERGLLRATHIRLNWQSLYQAFVDSHKVASRQPELYRQMALSAQHAATALLDQERSVDQLSQLVDRVFLAQPSTLADADNAATSDAAKLPDPRLVGLKDIVDHGWFNTGNGELCAGFPISARDRVLDFGCGAGAATLFCATIGAHVTFTDSDLPKLEHVARQVKQSIAQSWRGFLSEGLPLPVADGSISRVICMEVLEHLDDPLKTLKELVRTGESGALYLLTVPEARAERLQKKLAPPEHFAAPNHIQIFDNDSFANLIDQAGLCVESTQSMSFYWAMWFCFYWASRPRDEHATDMPTLDQVQPPYADVLTSWAETWQLLMASDNDHAQSLRHALDRLMPKSQVVIARKP